MAEFVKRIFSMRSEDHRFEKIREWLIDLFDDLYGLELHSGKAGELELREGWGRATTSVQEPIVVEARTPLGNEEEDVLKNIEDRLKANRNMNIGLTTDGVVWRFLILGGGRAQEYHDFTVGRSWTDDELAGQILGSVPPMRLSQAKTVIPDDFVEVFKIGSPIHKICSILIRSIAGSSSDFELQFDSWITEYRNVYPNFDDLCREMKAGTLEAGAEELHLRYAYYVTLVKMIAQVLVLGYSRFVEEMKNRPSELAVGAPLVEAGVRIVDVDENYSWIGIGSTDDLNLLLREMSNMLLRYDLSVVDEEVFRLMYEKILGMATGPPLMRKAF